MILASWNPGLTWRSFHWKPAHLLAPFPRTGTRTLSIDWFCVTGQGHPVPGDLQTSLCRSVQLDESKVHDEFPGFGAPVLAAIPVEVFSFSWILQLKSSAIGRVTTLNTSAGLPKAGRVQVHKNPFGGTSPPVLEGMCFSWGRIKPCELREPWVLCLPAETICKTSPHCTDFFS